MRAFSLYPNKKCVAVNSKLFICLHILFSFLVPSKILEHNYILNTYLMVSFSLLQKVQVSSFKNIV